jgi:hypothetical protein
MRRDRDVRRIELLGELARIEALGLELLEVCRPTSKPIASIEGEHPERSPAREIRRFG